MIKSYFFDQNLWLAKLNFFKKKDIIKNYI